LEGISPSNKIPGLSNWGEERRLTQKKGAKINSLGRRTTKRSFSLCFKNAAETLGASKWSQSTNRSMKPWQGGEVIFLLKGGLGGYIILRGGSRIQEGSYICSREVKKNATWRSGKCQKVSGPCTYKRKSEWSCLLGGSCKGGRREKFHLHQLLGGEEGGHLGQIEEHLPQGSGNNDR